MGKFQKRIENLQINLRRVAGSIFSAGIWHADVIRKPKKKLN